MLKKHGLNII